MIAGLLLVALTVEPSPPPPPPPVGPPEKEAAIEEAFQEPVIDVEDENLGQPVEVTLEGGQSLRGTLVVHTQRAITLELTGSGRQLVLPASTIKAIARLSAGARAFEHGGELWFEDPNRNRYFFGESAILLRQGEWSLSQKELAGSFIVFGVADFLNVELASVIPAYGFGTDGLNVLFGVRGGGTLLSWLHLSTQVQALVLPVLTRSSARGTPLVGMLSGTATFGDRSANFTVSAGMPFSFTSDQHFGPPLFALSGLKRLGKHVCLLTEHWLYLDFQGTSSGYVLVDGIGVRLMGEHVAFDLGVGVTSTNNGFLQPIAFPLPLVDFTYNFY